MEGRKAGALIGFENRDEVKLVGDRSLYLPPNGDRGRSSRFANL